MKVSLKSASCVFVAAIALAIALNVAWNLRKWGFVWTPPQSLMDIDEMQAVIAAGQFSHWRANQPYQSYQAVLPHNFKGLSQESSSYAGIPLGKGLDQVLGKFGEAYLDAHPLSEQDLGYIKNWVQSQGLASRASDNYVRTANDVRGVAIKYRDPDGKTLFYIAHHTGQIHNDHFAFAAAVMDVSKTLEGELGATLRRQAFDFDVAGTEGFYGWLSFSVICAFTLAMATMLVGLWWFGTTMNRWMRPPAKLSIP